ncbi:MAG TPA: hydrogenase maturation nickel metallochaperone HypA [Synergistaceae bacterium]|nr:hydrogenase maturation nickel metallochaperone HypA [Synergistaceae bacterium]HPJ25710.1 hydrogenase maturation nickel metallochaperone HypA [Synergistaceae bacterium]HPQ36972.1 hydrogenase maturation nickel metallochaperone HypA [Synergistaceae bacterium]
MHEYSLISHLLELLEDLAEEGKWPPPVKVRLRVGALRQVVPEIMYSCYASSVEGTFFEGSTLELEILPVMWQCEECGHIWEGEPGKRSCPLCGSLKNILTGGEELEIASVEVRDYAENC